MSAMKFERYALYKDSSAHWLGEIPSSWKLQRHKDAFQLISLRCLNPSYLKVALENIEGKTGRFISSDSEFDGDGIQFKKNDILFGKLRPYLAKVYLAEFNGNAIGDIFVYRPKPKVAPLFAAYLMRSDRYIDVVNSSTAGAKMPRASSGFIADLPVAIPSLAEQTTIAAYLDTKTSQIDRQINLLAQKATQFRKLKESLINETVTRGLEKSMLLKNSGVNWIGEVPNHWEIMRIKELFVESKLKSVAGDEDLLSVSEYSGVTLKQDSVGEDEFLTNAESLVGYKLCKKGDLVINIMLAWKRGLGVSPLSGIVSPSYAVYSPQKDIDPTFFHYRLRNEDAIAEFKRNSTGIIESRLRLYSDSFFALSIAVPPLAEQIVIAKYLDGKTAQIDRIVTAINTQINKLKDLRKALINDVVTGKIKVVSEGAAT